MIHKIPKVPCHKLKVQNSESPISQILLTYLFREGIVHTVVWYILHQKILYSTLDINFESLILILKFNNSR